MAEDVISLSSESDQDSDLELTGMYNDTERTAETVPFIKGRWVNLAAYSSFVIDLAAHPWALPPPRKRTRKDPIGPVEVVDLIDENSLSNESDTEPLRPKGGKGKKKRRQHTTSLNGTRGSDSPDCYIEQHIGPDSLDCYIEDEGEQEHPKRDSTVPEGHNKDTLEPCHGSLPRRDSLTKPTGRRNERGARNERGSDRDVPNGHAISPSLSESAHTGEMGETQASGLSESAHTGDKGDTPASVLPDHTTLESLEPYGQHEPLERRTVPEHPVSVTQNSDVPHHVSEHQQSPPVEVAINKPESKSTVSIDGRPQLQEPENREESGSPHTPQDDAPLDNTLSLSHQSLGSPSHSSDKVDPLTSHGYESPTQELESVLSLLSEPCSSSESAGPEHQPPLCLPLLLEPKRTPTPTSVFTAARASPECQLAEADLAVGSPTSYGSSVHSNASLIVGRTEEMDMEPGLSLPCQGSLLWAWKEGSDEGKEVVESDAKVVHRDISREDRRYVCPIELRKRRQLMAGPLHCLENVDVEDDGFGAPEQLCRQSLSLVYSTIEESYPEGTLQLLSDLLHPRFYPPKDITVHLLRDILLDHQAPRFLCVEAYTLLMRTQRHHPADGSTIPWDWELLTSVMAEQEHPKRHRSEQVSMLMQYVLQTLEDDFRLKLSLCDLHHSIAKATLSCQLTGRVSDVISWLMAAIVKSTRAKDCKEKEENLKMVFVLQKMLSLALEVDCSPAISSSKLCQRIFHTCIRPIRIVSLREHRMLLLETLESRLLKCNLLQQLLEHACPQKTTISMSLGLLLHFLKHCTLTPEPTDGAEMWQRWDELVKLLWMLLLSHEEVIRGHLRCPLPERAGSRPVPERAGSICTPDHAMSRSDVQEAVENFQSRSQADLGHSLPLHIKESLTYLQEHLMNSCQH